MAIKLFSVLFLFSFLMISCKEDDIVGCIDESKIDPNAACIEIYAPVCGCNDITYDNSCYAEIAGVTQWTEGRCED